MNHKATKYTESQLKSELFVNTLNNFINENIDTNNWRKWIYKENQYPRFE